MAMSSLGIWKIAVDTANVADGHSIAAYLTSSSGALLDSVAVGGNESLYVKSASEYAEDTAHASGDFGSMALVVRSDAGGSLVSADGDYSPLQVDATGRLRVLADLTTSFDFTYAEDSAAASGDIGGFMLLVRQDTLATSTSADGDYGAFKSNALGELYTHDTDANASLDAIETSTGSIDTKLTTTNSTLATIDTSLNNIETSTGSIDTKLTTTNSTLATIDTSLNNVEADTATLVISNAAILSELQALSQAEDAVHASGDLGIMSLAVRNDAGTALASDGDYIPLSTDASGNLRVAGTFSVGGTFAEDSAAASGDLGMQVLTVRKDALTTNVSADGDYGSFLAWSEGSVKVVDMPNIAVLATAVSVDTTAGGVALPASSLAFRRIISIQNRGDKSIFVGPSGVTTATGTEIPKGASAEFNAGPTVAFFGITASGTADVRVLQLS